MKRITALALAACLLLGLTLTGCGPKAPETTFPPIVAATREPSTASPTAAPTDPPATPEPTPDPTPTPNIEDLEIPPLLDNGLELPVSGATGFASVNLPVWPACPGDNTDRKLETILSTNGEQASFPAAMAVLVPGTGFQIIEEVGDWWHIKFVDPASMFGTDFTAGWIEHRYCFINLPDVIPSILYNDTNCSGSIFVSCGKDIPNVTGKSFYNTFAYNVRLARNEFIMPMLYTAARDVCAAQHKALAEGNCLEIYQTFRPLQTQKAVANAVQEMAKVDPEVKAAISTAPWSIRWFIATGTSDHQIGYALDATIVKMSAAEIKQVGDYSYFQCTDFERYEMPTPMHELSLNAASQVSPGNSALSEGLQNNESAQLLREYFTTSGFTPSPAQWWHFSNTAAEKATEACPSKGDYFTEQSYSTLPN